MTVTDRINAENEAKYGKIKECCDLYPPFCRCSLPNTLNVKGIESQSTYAMKIENSEGNTIWGVHTDKRHIKFLIPVGKTSGPKAKILVQELMDKYKEDLILDKDYSIKIEQTKKFEDEPIVKDQGLNLSQEFLDSISGDFRRKINKKTFLQRLIFWK